VIPARRSTSSARVPAGRKSVAGTPCRRRGGIDRVVRDSVGRCALRGPPCRTPLLGSPDGKVEGGPRVLRVRASDGAVGRTVPRVRSLGNDRGDLSGG